ncbi:MAG: efflux RND transporter periplasmic adaptor subunit [Rhodobacterales bacterium]
MSYIVSKIKYIVVMLVVVGGFFALLHSFLRDPSKQPVVENTPWALHSVIVKTGTVTEVFPALGKVESSSQLTIAPQISGTLRALGPREGGSVSQGDLLAEIDTRELVATRDAIKAQLSGARIAKVTAITEYKRLLKLMQDGYVSKSKLDAQESAKHTARAQVSSLENQIKALDVKISYGKITAPLDAGVIRRDGEVGDTVFPGKPIYVLSAHKGGRVLVAVPLSSLVKIKPGTTVELTSGADVFKSTISRVNPSLDKFSMGSVEIDLPKRPFDLPAGSPISANVITSEVVNSIIVPPDALVPSNDPKNRVLFRVGDGKPLKLAKTPVTVALCGREGCAVSGDIHQGDRVVHAHGSVLLRLRDGDGVMLNWKAE